MKKLIIKQLTDDEIASFKSELKQLLEKYSVNLQFIADNGSDFYGITGEKIAVLQNYDDRKILEVDGYCIGHNDI